MSQPINEWMLKRPTEPGFYWLEEVQGLGLIVVQIAGTPGGTGLCVYQPGRPDSEPLESRSFDGVRWHGPLLPPSRGKPDAVYVKYPGANGDMQTELVYAQGYHAQNVGNWSTLTCYACTSAEQARRAGELHLAVNRE